MEVLAELLANAIGQMRGLQGAELDASVDNAREKAQAVVSQIEKKVEDPETRERMGDELRKVIALLANAGSTVASAVAAHAAPIQKAIAGADLQKPTEALRQLAESLQNATPEPATNDEKRQEEIRAELKRSLDAIFKKTK